MAEIILQATPRPPQGTRPARRLRAEGKVPGVVYGLGGDPVPLNTPNARGNEECEEGDTLRRGRLRRAIGAGDVPTA